MLSPVRPDEGRKMCFHATPEYNAQRQLSQAMNSIVRWAGSKRSLLPELRAAFPKQGTFRRYVEPFAGSACLFFDRQPDQAILADLNAELVAAYRAIRRDPHLVVDAFRRLPRGEKAYYRVRAINPMTLSDPELAGRFLYLNRYCFNGLYRTNLQGRFNVPYGPPKKPLSVFESNVIAAAKVLRNADLFTCDFEQTVERVEKGDFVYLDPPYVVDDRRVFAEYLPGSFSKSDLERLTDALADIDRRGATFLLSYADCREARHLVKQWRHRRVMTRRNIAGFSGARRRSYEVLASNKGIV
jgi:DNA adenine methylase